MTLVYRVKDSNSIENNIDNKLQNRNVFYNPNSIVFEIFIFEIIIYPIQTIDIKYRNIFFYFFYKISECKKYN